MRVGRACRKLTLRLERRGGGGGRGVDVSYTAASVDTHGIAIITRSQTLNPDPNLYSNHDHTTDMYVGCVVRKQFYCQGTHACLSEN